MRAALLALLAACGPRTWTAGDTAGQLAVTAALAVDYRQTTKALEDPDTVEVNPIMGTRGDHVSPEIYFTGCAVLSAGAALALPKPWRSVLQGGIVAIQVDTITGNWVRFGRVW